MSSHRNRVRISGISLVEVVVSTGLLALVFVGATSAEGVQRLFSPASMARAALQLRSSMVADAMAREMSLGNLFNPAIGGTSLTYQLPVDPDGDGQFLDALGNIQWGMTLNGVAVAGANCTFSYVVDDQLDETALAVDLNRDGDQNDILDRGHLERQLSNGQSFRVSGSWILQPAGNHGGDLDGDLVPDPIFQMINVGTGQLLRVDLTTVSRVSASQWTTIRNRLSLAPRNSN